MSLIPSRLRKQHDQIVQCDATTFDNLHLTVDDLLTQFATTSLDGMLSSPRICNGKPLNFRDWL